MDNSAELKIRDEDFNRRQGSWLAFLCGVASFNVVLKAFNSGHNSTATRVLLAAAAILVGAIAGRAFYVRCRRCRLLVWPTTLVVVNPFRDYEFARSDVLGYRHKWRSKRTITYVYVRGRWRALWLVGLPADGVDELVGLLDVPYTRWRPAT
jgi:hypothetical protein